MSDEQKIEETLPVEVSTTPTTAMTLIDQAVKQGLSADAIEKLCNVHERISDRWEARQFHAAIHAFQAECPPIKKNKKVGASTSGLPFSYNYAELEQIEKAIRPILHKHNLSYSFDSEIADNGLRVFCTVRHIDGHKVTVRFETKDDSRGNKAISEAQKTGAVLTYGKRQALVAALGLQVGDIDTDGKQFEKIADDRLADLQAKMEETGITKRPAHLKRFLNYFKASSIADIPDMGYDRAINLLTIYQEENHD